MLVHSPGLQFKELIRATLLVGSISLLEWWFCKEHKSSVALITLVFAGCFVKVGFVTIRCFRQIVRISHKDVPYHVFLGFIALNIILVVFSFSMDYFSIFSMDVNSFSGLETAKTPLEQYFKLFYLSLLLFTNMGVANVVPVSIPAEALVMIEAIVSFVTLIFMLSDYVTLRESLNLIRLKKIKIRKNTKVALHWRVKRKRSQQKKG